MTVDERMIPPLELRDQWLMQLRFRSDAEVFAEIAQWGADQLKKTTNDK